MTHSLAPTLLVAMPSLLDPNFFRSVVLLVTHDPGGAFGVVVNRELDVPVASVCEAVDVAWHGDPHRRALLGGPVERHQGWVLHRSGHTFQGELSVRGEDGSVMGLSPSQGALELYGREPDGDFRLVMGYAGWGAGQLDAELAAGAWLTAPVRGDLIFERPLGDVWKDTLASIGVDPARLVDVGTSLN